MPRCLTCKCKIPSSTPPNTIFKGYFVWNCDGCLYIYDKDNPESKTKVVELDINDPEYTCGLVIVTKQEKRNWHNKHKKQTIHVTSQQYGMKKKSPFWRKLRKIYMKKLEMGEIENGSL